MLHTITIYVMSKEGSSGSSIGEFEEEEEEHLSSPSPSTPEESTMVSMIEVSLPLPILCDHSNVSSLRRRLLLTID